MVTQIWIEIQSAWLRLFNASKKQRTSILSGCLLLFHFLYLKISWGILFVLIFFFYFCLLLRQHPLRYFPAFDLYEHNHFHSYRLFILILVSAFDLYEVIISEFGHCIMALSWDYVGCKNPLPHGAPTSYIFIFH